MMLVKVTKTIGLSYRKYSGSVDESTWRTARSKRVT